MIVESARWIKDLLDPPPPKDALLMSGKPIFLAMARASLRLLTGSSVPSKMGTPSLRATLRAAVLSPIMSSTLESGPMKMMPSSLQAWANCGFSERKP